MKPKIPVPPLATDPHLQSNSGKIPTFPLHSSGQPPACSRGRRVTNSAEPSGERFSESHRGMAGIPFTTTVLSEIVSIIWYRIIINFLGSDALFPAAPHFSRHRCLEFSFPLPTHYRSAYRKNARKRHRKWVELKFFHKLK